MILRKLLISMKTAAASRLDQDGAEEKMLMYCTRHSRYTTLTILPAERDAQWEQIRFLSSAHRGQ